MKLLLLAVYVLSIFHVHRRGRVRHGLGRQLSDHSSFLAPLNSFLYLMSGVPNRPYLQVEEFPELAPLQQHWAEIRHEAAALLETGQIKRSDRYDDLGFNSFFKSGWKRFYLKWYGESPPSARARCPRTTALVNAVPSIRAAMFAELPPGSRLVRHRDPYAGSLRYHLGLFTPNATGCFIDVDGERYWWRDGRAVIFDQTFIHYAANETPSNRIILFCDVERPLRHRWATAFNRWFSRSVMAAASAPNELGDKTGVLNRAFAHVYRVRLLGKALKRWNRRVYYLLKWSAFAAVLFLLVSP